MTSKSAALVAAFAMVAVAAASPAVFAQERAASPLLTVAVGSRVRVSSPAYLTNVAGSVVALDGEAITIAADGIGALRVPRETIASLEVSRGRSRRTLKGAAFGTAIGALLGAVGYTPDPAGCAAGTAACSRGESVQLTALGGAAIGAWAGHRVQRDRWEPIALDRIRIGIEPERRGARASVSVGF
ncbi:MAG TPA: hypothetical protein VGQ78_01875 [Vicinamibacteria bacterium]|jgi:hypothetical protein|nr:hypothetical protein [Vicinamibacteria bacterium]